MLAVVNGNGAGHNHPPDDFPPSAFELWYAGYPHKIGRGAAERAFESVQQSHRATFAELVEGRDRYVEAKPVDRSWCNPATWLNQQRWQDLPATGPPAAKAKSNFWL